MRIGSSLTSSHPNTDVIVRHLANGHARGLGSRERLAAGRAALRDVRAGRG